LTKLHSHNISDWITITISWVIISYLWYFLALWGFTSEVW